MDNRRSNIEIIADILRLGHTKKTDIMYGCDLCFSQAQRYLPFLLERGLLEEDERINGRRTYRPTDEGKLLLAHIERVRELMDLPDRDAYTGEAVKSVSRMNL
jgi:predicted transcriptional regulator